MVRLRNFSDFMQPVRNNEYWMLDSGRSVSTSMLLERLKSKNYNHNSKQRARLQMLYIRCQRGLTSYEGFSARELKSFITQRALSIDLGKKPTVPGLRKLLEKADDDATFDRFLDLPPEIRQQIFTHYFDSLNDSYNHSPKEGQPPIALACRQTRQEALPLFYSRCRFAFDSQSYTTLGKEYRIPKHSADFLKNTSNDDFARIHLLSMSVDTFKHHIQFSVTITIDINDNERPLKVSRPSRLGLDTLVKSELRKKVSQMLALETASLVRAIAAREGVLKLQKKDISLLRNSVWKILQDVLRDFL
jgi:hypothetical protein